MTEFRVGASGVAGGVGGSRQVAAGRGVGGRRPSSSAAVTCPWRSAVASSGRRDGPELGGRRKNSPGYEVPSASSNAVTVAPIA
jgi:hypothetical protein